jgi:hypothetical protein
VDRKNALLEDVWQANAPLPSLVAPRETATSIGSTYYFRNFQFLKNATGLSFGIIGLFA